MATTHSKNRHEVLHLLDVENLYGSPFLTPWGCAALAEAYARAIGTCEGSQVILATSSAEGLVETVSAWPTARRLVRFGEDGADLALIDVMQTEGVSGRYRKIVIGSGDHIFTEAASQLQSLGCEVAVVSRESGLSRRLRFAVREVHLLPDLPPARTAWMAA